MSRFRERFNPENPLSEPPTPGEDLVARWIDIAQFYDRKAQSMDDREWYWFTRFEAYSYRKMAREQLQREE